MVYYASVDISGLTDTECDEMRERIKKHFSYGANLKRKESVAAKALLCRLLEEKFAITDFIVDCDAKGKPYIADSHIFFNLSHSGNFVMCAVGEGRVGCDIQRIGSCNIKVAKRFFTDGEFSALEDSSQSDYDFTRLWALKESALKFSGDGISGGLDRYDFSVYYEKDEFTIDGMHFNVYEMPDYVISICSENAEVTRLYADLNDIK